LSRRLVVLDGAPHADGSVGRMLRALAEGVREAGGEVDLYRCYELNVKPCIACGPNATSGFCIFHDDMDPIYAAMERAHAIVVGSPVHFDTVSAPLKLVIDRCNCITPLVTLPGGGEDCVPLWKRTRRGAFVTAHSAAHPSIHAERTVRGFLKWVGAKWEATLAWSHEDNDKGSVPTALLEEARALGRRLLESPPLEA
jgi:NAD(P)H-dependent FMN reductase